MLLAESIGTFFVAGVFGRCKRLGDVGKRVNCFFPEEILKIVCLNGKCYVSLHRF